jgi:PAS domain S-box-containing protein
MHSALRESGAEARLLAGVLEAVEDAVYVLDEAGSLVCWNDRFEARTGYADEELAALDPGELVAGEPDGDAAAALDPPAEGIARVDLVTGDGERVPHEVRGTAVEVPGSGGRYTCVVARDVSERPPANANSNATAGSSTASATASLPSTKTSPSASSTSGSASSSAVPARNAAVVTPEISSPSPTSGGWPTACGVASSRVTARPASSG